MDIQSESVASTLRDALSKSFENLAFAEVTDWQRVEEGGGPDGEFVGAAIAIRHPGKGGLAVFLKVSHCCELVETIYGSEPTLATEYMGIAIDFMNEFANTVAGRFAACLAGDDGRIGLGLPETVSDPAEWLNGKSGARETFSFEVDMNPGFCVLLKD